jgi:hypothetical protein
MNKVVKNYILKWQKIISHFRIGDLTRLLFISIVSDSLMFRGKAPKYNLVQELNRKPQTWQEN